MTSPWAVLRGDPSITLVMADFEGAGTARCYPELRTILLDTGLTQVQRRCALAHELAHLDLEHGEPATDQAKTRQEADADAYAARQLITIHALTRAMQIYGELDTAAIADELWVDVPTLQARLLYLHPAERHHLRRALTERET